MKQEQKLSKHEIIERLFREPEPPSQLPSGGLLCDYGPILSVQDVSEIIRMSRKTIYEKLSTGEMPGRKLGRSWAIPRDTFEDYLHKSN